VGDIRVDAMRPCELIEVMREEDSTSLEDARDALEGLLPDTYVGRDIVQELYEAADPTAHPLREHLESGTTVKTDVLSNGVPLAEDTFHWTLCDPPWKEVEQRARERLFDEVVRITKPGGHILFNAWWIPMSDHVTLDELRIRQDLDRHPTGTPSVSYAGIYTVHSSADVARYLSQTFTTREFAPEPASLKEALEAEVAFRLERVEGVDAELYDVQAVGPDPAYRCPHCGNTTLDPATTAAGYNVSDSESLYICRACEYPVSKRDLEQIAAGDLQRVRHEAGFSELTEADLAGVNPADPPERIRQELAAEPGIQSETVEEYLSSALPVGTQSKEHEIATLEELLEEKNISSSSGSEQVTFSDLP
jgi:hypothetical protein